MGIEQGFGIAVDALGNAYVTGVTVSTDFPTTAGAFDRSCGTDGLCNSGFSDAFVTKIPVVPAIALSTRILTFPPQLIGTTSSPQAVKLANLGDSPLIIPRITISGPNSADFAQTNSCASSVAPQGNCAINVTFTPSEASPQTDETCGGREGSVC